MKIKKLFDFAYNDSHTEDRFEIMQNVIILYSSNVHNVVGFNVQLQNIIETIQRHFTLYINNEVNHFLGQTKALLEESQKHATQAKEETDKIISNINQTILGIITVLISGLLAIINQSTKLLVASIIIHILYFLVSYYINSKHSEIKKQSIMKGYDFYSSKYSNLSTGEKKELELQYVKPGLGLIDKYNNRYKRITLFISFLLLLMVFLGAIWPDKVNILLSSDENNKNEILSILSLEEGSGGNARWWETQNQGISEADKKLVETVMRIIKKDKSLKNIITPNTVMFFNSSTLMDSVYLTSSISDKNSNKFYNLNLNYRIKNHSYRSMLTIQIDETGLLLKIRIDNTFEL